MEYLPDAVLERIWNELKENEKEKLVKNLARILRGIHSIKFEMFGEIEEFDHPRKFYSLESMVKVNIRRYGILLGKTKIIPIDLVTNAQISIEKELNKWSFHSQPSLLHRDLNLENFLAKKNEADEWIISAVLDFEWSYSGNPLFDLFEINEIIEDTKLQKVFFLEYFEGEKQDLEEFKIERKIVSLYHALETAAIGWVHFHPSEENVNKVIREIKGILQY